MPDDYGVLLSKSPVETEQKPDYSMLLGGADDIRRNYDLSRGTDPKHEAAVAKVSSLTGIGKPLLNSDPNPENMLPMQTPAPGVTSYLQDMGNMIVSRDDIHNLNAVEPKALAFNLDYAKGDLSGQMRTNIQRDIQANGYTDGQKAELIANGYRPNIDGTWNTPDGKPVSSPPVLDAWVQTAEEKKIQDEYAQSLFGGDTSKKSAQNYMSSDDVPAMDARLADFNNATDEEKAKALDVYKNQIAINAKRMQALGTITSEYPDFLSMDSRTQESVVRKVMNLPADAAVDLTEYTPHTWKQADVSGLVNWFGTQSIKKYFGESGPQSAALQRLAAVGGDLSKLGAEDLIKVSDFMQAQADNAQGGTLANEAIGAVATTLGFMGELVSTSGVTQAATKSALSFAGKSLLSPEMLTKIAAKYGAKTSELSLAGMGAKAALHTGELAAQELVRSPLYVPGLTALSAINSMPDTLKLTEDEKGKVIASVEGVQKNQSTEFLRAFMSNYTDRFTEGTGEKMIGLAGGLYAKLPGNEKISEVISKLTAPARENIVAKAAAIFASRAENKGAFLAGINKFGKGAKWDGFFGEWLEEDLGKLMNYVSTQVSQATGIESLNQNENQPFAYGNPREITIRAIALAVPSLGFGTARLGAHIMEARDTNHFVNKAEDLNKALYNTQTAQRSPIHAALFLDAQGVKGDIYMNSQELLDLENKNPGLLEKIGAPLDLVTRAADTNLDLAVPAVRALSLQPEVFAQLRNTIRPGVDSPSVADLGKVDLKPIAQAAMEEPQRIASEEKIFQTKLAEKKSEALKAGRSSEEVDAWGSLVEGMANRLAQYGGDRMAMLDYSIQKANQAEYFNRQGELTQPAGVISFWHGGLNADFNLKGLDVLRPAVKQQKKGRNYAGFYMYDESAKKGAETYSEQSKKELHRFDIANTANILELGNIERVTQTQLQEYRNQGYDLLKGKDVRGRIEYILLNKNVVKQVVNEKALMQTSDSINGMVDTQPADIIKVFHHSEQNIAQFKDNPEGTWFTSNEYGYARRPKASVHNVAYVSKNLKWAKEKDMGPWLGKPEEVRKNLMAQGYDGVKYTVDGDTHYLVFDAKNIQREGLKQTDVTQNLNFKKWFGDSKVVDVDGKPLIVYHGTDKIFDTFNPNTAAGWGKGIYLTDNKDDAKEYSGKGQVMEVYVSIKNPYTGARPSDEVIKGTKAWQKVKSEWADPQEAFSEDGSFANAVIRELGYDGIIVKNSNNVQGLEIVAFESNQVKSATGNNGAYDPNNPNIYKQTSDSINGMVDTQAKLVSLFQTANPSTLIHETAHIFKHEMDLLLQDGPPNAELARDMEVLNAWLNAKPETSQAEYVRMQEQFASGLETYLMEGKAPSVKLAAVFERYKNWLLNVYTSIKNFLAVRQDSAPLNDDMRGFFDRMLATHDETVQAMNIAKMSMYDSPELGGNLEYQVHAKELLAEAVRESEANINAKREQYIKEHKAEWRKDAEDKVYSDPLNQAWKKIEDEGGLDKKDLELELSKEEIKTLRDKGLVQSGRSKRSISHILIAGEHGFNGGSELLTALLKAESPKAQIKALLDARIKEFTDTFRPEDYFAEAAAMAKYLELRSDQLNELINQSRVDKNQWKTELNALTNGKVDTPFQTAKLLAFVKGKGIETESLNTAAIADITSDDALDKDVRRVLEIVQIGRRMQNVAKTLSQDAYRSKIAEQMKAVPVGQLESPGHYLRAFKKNMQEAVYAIRKKDWGAALNYNNLARQNYEQLRRSREIRDKVATTVRAVRRAFTAKPGVIEGDFQAWMQQIGRKFGLTERKVDSKLPKAVQLASDNIYFGEEYEPWIREGLLDPKNFALLPDVSYKGMTAGNFESLANLVDYMDRQGRSMAEGWDATNKKKVVEIMKEIDKVFASNPAQVVEVQDNTGLGVMNELQKLTRSYHAEMARLLFVCRELDDFSALKADGEIGPCEQYLYGAMNKAADAESKLSYTIGKQAAPFVKTLNKWVLANSGILRGEGVPDLPSNMKGRYKGWTSEMLLAYMFNRGQADNLQKFIDGYPGLSVADMDAFCAKFAGEEQWKAVQGLLDIIDSFWPELDRVHYNMKLTHMGKMEATAFDITTKEGKVITQKGGYYPVWYDRSLADFQRGSDMTELDFTNKLESEAINIMLFTPKAVPAKFAKARQESAKLPIYMSMTPLYRYIYGAIHYVTHAEAGRDVMRLVDYKGKPGSEVEMDFRKNLTRVLGADKAEAMREHLLKVIAPSFEKLDTFDKITNWLRASSTLSALGGKLMPSIKQLQSAPRFLYELGPVKFLDGVMSFYAAPVEMFQMINEKSAFMHNRYEGSDTILRRGVDGVMTGKWTRLNNSISEWAYMPMRIMDSMSSYPGWLAQYKSELVKNGGNEEEAIASADRLIQFSQATDRNIDKSEFQMGEKGVKRLLNMFFAEAAVFGQRMKTYNKAWRNGKISTMSYIMYLMCDLIMPAMIAGLADYLYYGAQPKPGKEDKTWSDYFYKNLGSSVVSGTPVVRDLAESTYNLFTGSKGNFNITPMNMTVELTGRTVKSMVYAWNSDSNTFEGQQNLDKFYLNLAETIGFATRSAPVVNIYKQFKRIEKRIDEEEGVTP